MPPSSHLRSCSRLPGGPQACQTAQARLFSALQVDPYQHSFVFTAVFTNPTLQVSTYSFETHKKSFALQVLDVKTGCSTTLYNDSSYSEPTWVTETDFVFIRAGDKGTTSLMLASTKTPSATCVHSQVLLAS